jgi:porin
MRVVASVRGRRATRGCLPVVVALLWMGPSCAPAQEAGEAPTSQPGSAEVPAQVPYSLLTTERLTGNWWGARPWLEEHGITFEMATTAYFQSVARGGLNTRHAHNIIGTNDIELTFDFTKLRLVPGGTAYMWATNAWGESPSTRGWVGDLFGVNGGEVGNRPMDVHELWYEQALLDDKLRIRLGKLCLASSFDTNDFASWDPTTQFMNYGLNVAPNIPFPANGFGALGVQSFVTPVPWLYLGAGVVDADAIFNDCGFATTFHGPANTFSMYEFGLAPTFAERLPGHYRFGLWYDPQPKEEFFDSLGGRRTTIPRKRDDVGFYVNFDQVLWREKPEDEENTEGLGIFARYSYAHADANLIEHFWSFGGQYQGLIPRRDNDVLALGVGQGLLSKQSRLAGFDPHCETALETYYAIQLLPWLTLTPDMQWILRPGGENGRDAWVIGLRLQVTF